MTLNKKRNIGELIEFDKNELKASKCKLLIGTDEAGRGPATGPVFAAAVCFKESLNPDIIEKLARLNDSKQLTEKVRDQLYPIITENSVWATAFVDEKMIDRINILNASHQAMKDACMAVVREVQTTCMVLVDGNHKIRGYEFPQKAVIKGDSKSASIAAASILAKVERDNLMRKLHLEFPEYNWASNKGYLSEAHIEAILRFGPTKYHRKTFLRNILEKQGTEQKKLDLTP